MNDSVVPRGRALSYAGVRHLLPPRARDAHKGHFGHVLIIGGSPGFAGAVMMAAEAAGRSGAGLVTVATHPAHAHIFPLRRPEVMSHGIHEAHELLPLLARASVIVLGPGLGQSEWSRALFDAVIDAQEERPRPLLLDADALNLLALLSAEERPEDTSMCVLTPHPGEAARLLDCIPAAINDDREHAALALEQAYGGTIVLKGQGTLVCYPHDDEIAIDHCSHGNPGMASGGMGDILSGLIGGLMAQHLAPADAARLGVCIHALSADEAVLKDGERGLLATDLLPWIRRLANID